MTTMSTTTQTSRFVEYIGTDGATYRLVDADGIPAEYDRPYTDRDGHEFTLTRDYLPSAADGRVGVSRYGYPGVQLSADYNLALGRTWAYVRQAECGERYCISHEEGGDCVYAKHVEWCTGAHSRDGDCIVELVEQEAGVERTASVEATGSTVDGGTVIAVEARISTRAELAALIATLVEAEARLGDSL